MNDLVQIVKDAGIVGAGGAGFPTHVKLSSKVDTIIANGAECEPLLYSDKVLMTQYTKAVLEGLRAAARAVGARRVVLATKRTYKEVLTRIRQYADKDIEVFELEDFYPAGDEHILVHEVTKRVIPPGGIPLNVNVVVQNVATLFAIYRALSGEPFIQRYVTVTGNVQRPGVYLVPVGTPLWWLLRQAGSDFDNHVIINGGPMMGRVVTDKNAAVTKTTSGIIVLPKDHVLARKYTRKPMHWVKTALAACTQCRRCTDLCPRHLLGHPIEPHKAMRTLAGGMENEVITLSAAFICSQCGVCELYACPMDLSPRQVYAMMKAELVAAGAKYTRPKGPFEAQDAYEWSKIPKHRIMERLELTQFDRAHSFIKLKEMPGMLTVLLKQHIGAPAVPVVSRGVRVTKGDVIGEIPQGQLGARVHAPADGIVSYVDNEKVIIEVQSGI